MSEFHCPVVKVGRIEKHGNADTLSIAYAEGREYPVVIRTGDFEVGDKALYVCVDALVPVEDERFAFLKARQEYKEGSPHYRIRAARLRGVFSMGLLVPAEEDWEVGADMIDVLGIGKYEPEVRCSTGGDAEPGPEGAPKYTDIEGLRAFPDLLIPGEKVAITEKLHGCVVWNTWVTMGDGTKKRISQVNVGDEVMGVDEAGLVTTAHILRRYDNGKAERWLNVRGTRRGAGQGNSFFSIHCTPEHRFFVPQKGEYVPASHLREGDTVIVLRSDADLTPVQEQILIGMMLGDASLTQREHSAAVVWSHQGGHEAYMDWVERGLEGVAHPTRNTQTSGYGTAMLRQKTVFSAAIKDRFADWVDDAGRKRVPGWVANALAPVALAFWYMDDGSLSHHEDQEDRALFAVCGFTEEDCAILVRGLAKFGIDAVYYQSDGGRSRLRLNTTSAERLFLLIAPYIPPAMQYKLPERYRGHEGWLPSTGSTFRRLLVPQTITSISDSPIKSLRYDIETTTHNYFANDVLTHNSNGRWVYTDGRLYAGSMNQWKKPDPENAWWKAAAKHDLEEKLRTVPGLVLFGEVFGPVQDLKYGKKDVDLAVFDMYSIEQGRYLNYHEFTTIAGELGLPCVPLLYVGKWRKDFAQTFSNGPSTVEGAGHMREGCVIKPCIERRDDTRPYHNRYTNKIEGERVILKMVGEDYLLRKQR